MSNTNSASLTVTIPAHLDAFIKDRVARGRYETEGEAIRTAIELLEERERQRDAVIDEIRREIELGIQQAEAGQVRDGEEVFRDIRARLGMG